MDFASMTFKLDVFEGPLDLLMHLIAKNKVAIDDIPIALILDQYLSYLETMRSLDIEVTSDFIVMAAQLILIKSRMVLPRWKTRAGNWFSDWKNTGRLSWQPSGFRNARHSSANW